MNYNNLFSLIHKSGGFSVSIDGKIINPQSGYMLGMKGYEVTIPLKLLSTHFLSAYYNSVSDMIRKESYGKWFFGGWIDNKDNVVYLDLSMRISDLEVAIDMAIKNKQLAIWDCEDGREIRLENMVEIEP